jgi:hypothetical protein
LKGRLGEIPISKIERTQDEAALFVGEWADMASCGQTAGIARSDAVIFKQLVQNSIGKIAGCDFLAAGK